jgi:hypothetical protein
MKVFIHVEEIFPRVPVYHVGVGYKWGPFKKRYDYQPDKGWVVPVTGRKETIEIGKSTKNIFEINRFQKELQEQKYFLGFRDCRHFSQDLIQYSCDNYVNVINMFNLRDFHTHQSKFV